MKRRSTEYGKLRRPIKRNKIAEGINTFLYAKYFVLWGVVVTADFMLDFRFELLWPFWLLLRSVYDSYKYKGLTFTILFVCIAITSDLVCMFFIPISWLFFLASTYVWVQYVWHAVDKGACLPTIFLWTIFLYLEGAVRWRDEKSVSHVDLCRPFAAHCIGYPVVTLGFGIKSYIGYRIRHRKQREVAKENEFFIQLLQLALPNDNPIEDEIIAQMQQTSEILHSDKFGEIDLPISSPIITQRIQQQRLILVTKVLNGTTTSSVTNVSGDASGSSHKQISNHNINGFSSQIAVTSKINQSSSSSSTLPIATVSASTGTATQPVSTVAPTLNHSNNNNLGSSNLNLATSYGNGFNVNHQSTNSQTHHTNSASNPTYRQNRRSAERSENHDCDTNASSSTSTRFFQNFCFSHNGNNADKQKMPNIKPSSSSSNSSLTSLSSPTSTRNLFGSDGSGKLLDTVVHDNSVSRFIFNLCARTSVKTLIQMFGDLMRRWYHSMTAVFVRNKADQTIPATKSTIKHKLNNHDGHGNGTENGISSLHMTRAERLANEHSHRNKSPEKNGLLNTAIVAPLNTKPTTDSDTSNANGQCIQGNYGNFHQHTNESEKNFCKQNNECDTQFNQLENNCNNPNNTEIIERGRGRKNRGKHKDVTQHHLHTNLLRNSSPLSQQSERCESCSRLENEIKRMRNDINHLKHIEHELRHKSDQNATTKNCLLAKQKENEELERKLQEAISTRQMDKQNLQQTERRLNEERRLKQSIESQLNHERKQRKIAEEKLSRIDCSENCKSRKQMLENECKQLRKDLTTIEELKKSAEKQSRNYEQELRKFEAELRSREPRESTEVLMSALQAMQEKNKTLEKNLSAETRVKLDLFSALGEAKRQLEIRDNVIRQKDKELVDLKSKIAQLYVVMPSVPSEQYLPQCASPLLRLSDTGPSSPLSHATDTIFTPKSDVS